MEVKLANYQYALVHCMNCGYIRLVKGPIPDRYVNTSTHECPECRLEKVRIRLILMRGVARMVVVKAIAQALTETNKEDIYQDLLIRALPMGRRVISNDSLREAFTDRARDKFMEGLSADAVH